MKKLYSKGQLEFLVGSIHVGTSDEEVEKTVREHTAKWPKSQQNMAVKDAVKIHHKNRGVYNTVMSGTF